MVVSKPLEIVDSTAAHTRQLQFNDQSHLEANACREDPNRLLFQVYRRAVYRKTALVDNHPVAMWGVVGTPLSVTGYPYFETGLGVEKIPKLRLIKTYKQEVQIMNGLFPVLTNYVQDHHYQAIGALRLAGFTISEPELINGSLYRKYQIMKKDY